MLSTIFKYFNQRNKYLSIKKNPEKREKSVYFGVIALIKTIFFAALTALFAFGLIFCVKSFTSNNLHILLAVLGCITCGILLFYSIFGLVFSCPLQILYQIRLNKRAIGWVALAIYIASVAVAVFLIVYFGLQL